MPLRLIAAASMAAVLATLSVMIVRAVVDPPIMPDIAARETFLLQHVGIGLAGGLALQLAYRLHGLPSYPRSLLWGAGGFAAAVLAPERRQHGGALLFWIFTVAVTGAGLWLLLAVADRWRLIGLALLAAPPLLAPASAWREHTGLGTDSLTGDIGGALPLDAPPDAPPILPPYPMEYPAGEDAVLLLGLNLLFWLLLGAFSVLAARRIMDR
jgi:hypothetical protein